MMEPLDAGHDAGMMEPLDAGHDAGMEPLDAGHDAGMEPLDAGHDAWVAPTCDDGVENGDETDVDCGGPDCEACGAGDGCQLSSDCETGLSCTPGLVCRLGPTAGLTLSTSGGDAPLPVTATSTATPGDAPITSVEYDWGAGYVTSSRHTLSTPGSISVVQRVTDANGLTALAMAPVSVSAFTPVRISETDRESLWISHDGLQVEPLGHEGSGGRSNLAIQPGSGVFYFEAQKLIERNGDWGFGIATASAALVQTPGATSQTLGMVTWGNVPDDVGSRCMGSAYIAWGLEWYGFVVDYRGPNPVLFIVIDRGWGDGPEIPTMCVMTGVTEPVHAFFASARRWAVGAHARLNFGNDTTHFPFHFSDADVRAALAELDPTAAAALVRGFGQTRARPADDAPVLTPPSPVTVPFGTPVTLEATAIDTEEGDISARIEWADLATNHFAPTGGTGPSFTFTPNAIGRHPVRVRVRDAWDRAAETTVMVTVTGAPPQHDPVRLVIEPGTGVGMTLTDDGLGVRFSGGRKDAILANQGLYGEFWYYEAHRETEWYPGAGLSVRDGDFDPYTFTDPPYSMSINVGGDTWENLISSGIHWDPANTWYGFAVDYRGEHPIVHVIIGDALVASITMAETWVPVYPMIYGGTAFSDPPAIDMSVNFGTQPFHYDPVAILTAAGVDASGLEVGWGDANTMP